MRLGIVLMALFIQLVGYAQATSLKVNVDDCEGAANGSIEVYHNSTLVAQKSLVAGSATLEWNNINGMAPINYPEVAVFPNPTTNGQITFDLANLNRESTKIVFSNLLGQNIGSLTNSGNLILPGTNNILLYTIWEERGYISTGRVIVSSDVLDVNIKYADAGIIKNKSAVVNEVDFVVVYKNSELKILRSETVSMEAGTHTDLSWVVCPEDVYVEITSPLNGATLSAGDVTVTVDAYDNGGSIANVKFSINDYFVNQDNSFPYSYVFNNLEGGTYTITAVAEDNDGNTTNDSITFTVTSELLSGQFNFIRLNNNKPIMDKQMFKDAGANRNIRDDSEYEWDNMNGPCVIRIPDWIDTANRADPDAVYYMYFGHHHGQCIRMAWAKEIEGPWTLYNMGAGVAADKKGVLAFDNNGNIGRDAQITNVGNNLSIYDHMSSPEILIDDENHQIIMYFHTFPLYNGVRGDDQVTFVATSDYGLSFFNNIRGAIQSESYFSVFRYNGELYGLHSNGTMWRHPDPDNNLLEPASGIGFDYSNDRYWEKAPSRAVQWREGKEGESTPYVRHIKNHVEGDILYAAYSATRGVPERLFYVTVDLSKGDWQDWYQEPEFRNPDLYNLAKAEAGWEGGQYPVVASLPSAKDEGVNQLRDPDIFKDTDGQFYIFYSGQGEDAIGVARWEWKD